jgi:8-oxo-dGTP pyrophosphatase MutT (NUDIX family)
MDATGVRFGSGSGTMEHRQESPMPPTPWKTLSCRYVLRDRWMTLRADRCETATGVVIDPYYVQEPEDWVQVVAFDPEDRILVIRQYRHAAGLICAELPGGGVERGEIPAHAAARELLEETGCAAQTLKPLQVMSPNPARYSNRMHTFIATGTRQVQQQQLDATEEIEFEFLTLPQVLSLIDAGSFLQAMNVGSLFLALRSRGLITGGS